MNKWKTGSDIFTVVKAIAILSQFILITIAINAILYIDTQGLHLLFEPFLIDEENGGLLPGYIFIALLCASERGLSYYMGYRQHNESLPTLTATTGQRIAKVMIRTILYGIITTLRLLYMLVVMYFNTGLFILVVSKLK